MYQRFRETVALTLGVLLRLDPAEHDRLRAVVNKALAPRAVSGYKATIDSLVDGLLALTDALEYQPTLIHRGLVALPVRVTI